VTNKGVMKHGKTDRLDGTVVVLGSRGPRARLRAKRSGIASGSWPIRGETTDGGGTHNIQKSGDEKFTERQTLRERRHESFSPTAE